MNDQEGSRPNEPMPADLKGLRPEDFYEVPVLLERDFDGRPRDDDPQSLDDLAALWQWLSNRDRRAITRCAEAMAAGQITAHVEWRRSQGRLSQPATSASIDAVLGSPGAAGTAVPPAPLQ